jgi:DNA polymerase sigma
MSKKEKTENEIFCLTMTIKFLEKEIKERDELLEKIQKQIYFFNKGGFLP